MDIGSTFAGIGTYGITFVNNGTKDRTEFFATGTYDLIDLWTGFCEENHLDPNCWRWVSLVQSDSEILEEFLERTGATVSRDICRWCIVEGEGETSFIDWDELIGYMNTQNEEMRG